MWGQMRQLRRTPIGIQSRRTPRSVRTGWRLIDEAARASRSRGNFQSPAPPGPNPSRIDCMAKSALCFSERLIAEVPIVLITRKDLPVNNLQEFGAYAKANRAKMQYGSAGAGSATHLGCVLLNYLIGGDITHVPYRGTGPAMQDLQGGRIDYLCEIVSTAKLQIDGGTVKGIAMMTKERSKASPDVPTALEQWLPNLEAYTWNAIFLPKGAPAEMVNKLNHATVEAMQSANVRERLEGLGAVIVPPVHATPEYLAHFVRGEIAKGTGPIKASGVIVE